MKCTSLLLLCVCNIMRAISYWQLRNQQTLKFILVLISCRLNIMDVPVDLLPTHIAAAKNDVQELARLVQQGELVIDNDTKESPLHAAARTGSVDALRWLLENRVASPLTKASNGNTAAHYAVVYGHAGALKVPLMFAISSKLWVYIY